MAKTYEITYSTTLYAHFYIEAESEEDAIAKASGLLDNDTFVENQLIPALDDPYQWGDAIRDCNIEAWPTTNDNTMLN